MKKWQSFRFNQPLIAYQQGLPPQGHRPAGDFFAHKVLSVFDQTQHLSDTEHFLNIDDNRYQGDEDMQPILHRLLMAAADADMRQDMNVEDEYYSIIEKRDTKIMLNAKKIAKQNAQLKEQNAQLKEQDAQLKEQDAQLKSMAKILTEAGLSVDDIAAKMNLTVEKVKELLA